MSSVDLKIIQGYIASMVTGEEIKAAREQLGESQVKFARRIGIARPTLHNWENGHLPQEGPSQALAQRVLAELTQRAAE